MPITLDETIVTFNDAAKEMPRRRKGRKTHVSCIYRWSTIGCRGVVLESRQVGGTRCTSREALQRFFERLSESRQPTDVGSSQSQPIVGLRTPAERQRDAEKAGRKLIEMGA